MPNVTSGMPPAMILCGGQGTRIRDVTELLPKPMVPIGPHPIVWHIMKTYSAFGVKRFILCLGYKREVFIDYFLNYHARATDITVRLGKEQDVTYHNGHGEEDWEVTLVDTGDRTMTGGRVFRAAKYLCENDADFFLTYGDAVANVRLDNLLSLHRNYGRDITVTAVHPAGRYGELKLFSGAVTSFHEKPEAEEYLINGGFMVLKRSFIDRFLDNDDDLVFERKPMTGAMEAGEMSAYEHRGFWQCMDTAREHTLLNGIWDQGNAPWTEFWT